MRAGVFMAAMMPLLVTAAITVREDLTYSTTTLDEKVYFVRKGTMTYTAKDCKSALSVAKGKTAVLLLEKGAVLNVKGGNASGMTGAGAGIHVPEDSVLIVTGEGTLNATGGNAAKGKNGGDVSFGFYTNDKGVRRSYGGWTQGGKGGDGGGGAAAAIGGIGGDGSAGGAGGYGKRHWDDSGWGGSGGDGGNSGAASNGGNAGTVFLLGTVSVKATLGDYAEGGNGGKSSEKQEWDYSGYSYNVVLGKSSGGGGGAGGANAQSDIGGGGEGGCGGSGGGSGAIVWAGKGGSRGANDGVGSRGSGGYTNPSDTNTHGKASANYTFTSILKSYSGSTFSGGSGGSKPGNGKIPDRGTIKKVDVDWNGVKLDGGIPTGGRWSKDDPLTLGIKHTITFDENVGSGSRVVKAEVFIGYALPPHGFIPTDDTKIFLGWYDQAGRGYYNAAGDPLLTMYDVVGDVTLYPRWAGASGPVGVFVNGRELNYGGSRDDGWEYDGYLLTLTGKDYQGRPMNYTISGTHISGRVRIAVTGDCEITLDNLRDVGSFTSGAGLMAIARNVTVRLKLTGVSELSSPLTGAAIYVPQTAKLIVSGEGALIANGGSGAAGIGGVMANDGSLDRWCGTIHVLGGTIYALAGNDGLASPIGNAWGNGSQPERAEVAWKSARGEVIIDGGSVETRGLVFPHPRNSDYRPLTQVTLSENVGSKTWEPVKYEPTINEGRYGVTGIMAHDRHVHLWLPSGTFSFKNAANRTWRVEVERTRFSATVK